VASYVVTGDHVVLAAPERPFTSDEEFLDWCARRSVIPLDHTRPLWRMDVIPGLAGQVGVLMVMHHVLADGLRGVATIGALLDPAPGDERDNPPGWRPEPLPTALGLVTDNLPTWVRAIRRARPGQLPRRLRTLRGGQPRAGPARAAHLADRADRSRPAAPGPAAAAGRPARPGAAHGCTITDLLLAAVTTGLRDMLAERGAWHVPQPTAEATEVAWLDSTQVTACMAEAFAIRLIDALETGEPRMRLHDGQHLLS
jgi:diacylglycerol O-acyltransferase